MFTPQAFIAFSGDAPGSEPGPDDTPQRSSAVVDPNAQQARFATYYESSQGRYENPLGNDPHTAGIGRAEAGEPGSPYVDWWGDQLIYTGAMMEGSPVNTGGRGDRTQLPGFYFPERIARRFIAYFFHEPYQGSQELRENVGGHVVIRRMPNAGQAQGGMGPWSAQVNQRRIMPPRWDANAFING